jgi:hypothetical protein
MKFLPDYLQRHWIWLDILQIANEGPQSFRVLIVQFRQLVHHIWNGLKGGNSEEHPAHGSGDVAQHVHDQVVTRVENKHSPRVEFLARQVQPRWLGDHFALDLQSPLGATRY